MGEEPEGYKVRSRPCRKTRVSQGEFREDGGCEEGKRITRIHRSKKGSIADGKMIADEEEDEEW